MSLAIHRLVSLRSSDTEFRRELRPEQRCPVLVDDVEQLARIRIIHDELHQDRHVTCQFEEMLLVQDPVSAKTRDSFKDRSSMDMGCFGFLQDPFVKQDAAMLLVLVHVETKRITLHNERLQ